MRPAMRYCVLDDRCIGRTMEGRPSGDLLIAGAVGPGCTNGRDDVLVVQSLLNVAYARIRVPSRTIPVDGIVGPETHAALLHFQRTHFGAGDGRVEPAGRTLVRLNAVAAGPPRASGTARSASVPSPLELALGAAALARRWAVDAREHLAPLLETSGRRRRQADRLATVNTHFHLDRDASGTRGSIARVVEVFARIEQVLGTAADVFREGATLVGSPVVEAPDRSAAIAATITKLSCASWPPWSSPHPTGRRTSAARATIASSRPPRRSATRRATPRLRSTLPPAATSASAPATRACSLRAACSRRRDSACRWRERSVTSARQCAPLRRSAPRDSVAARAARGLLRHLA